MLHEIPSNEKLLAGLAYLLGLIPAVIVWAVSDDESGRVRFHAVQAAIYDGIVSLVALLVFMVSVGVIALLIFGVWVQMNLIADLMAPETPLIYLTLSIVMVLIINGWGILSAALILCLNLVNFVAAIYVFTGKDWRYPVIAKWAEHLIRRGKPVN